MTGFKFEIVAQSKKSRARAGIITTPHGKIHTPAFVAVGTNGTIKALDSVSVSSIGLELMFCNTYHLLLQPGPDIIEKAGGIHKFISRDMPIITDSGGFQVFSLAYGSVAAELKSRGQRNSEGLVLKISEEGVAFRSYRDGQKILLTPESSVAAQKKIGADIIIPFDELPPYHTESQKLLESLERTHRWEERSLRAHLQDERQQAMYAVVHGGIDLELRQKSCRFLGSLAFNGFAIGGSVGKNRQEMYEMLEGTVSHLPGDQPIHLLGIGDLPSLSMCVPLGIDTFDSSYPTRAARHALLLTKEGPLKITKKTNACRFEPADKNCTCAFCKNYSLAYLHHLFKAGEMTGYTLATIHNLHFMVQLMKNYRKGIIEGAI